jgi:replication initiation protein RepC
MNWMVNGGGEVRSWRDFLAAAEIARSILGISPSAWEQAQIAMGEQQAAITLAAIHQKSAQIKSPGGYLRNLTERAKEGKFSAWPMIMALLRGKLDAAKAQNRDAEGAEAGLDAAGRVYRTEARLEISDALKRSLSKPFDEPGDE